MRPLALPLLALACLPACRSPKGPPPPDAPQRANEDEFTRYLLESPRTGAFRIEHDVTAVAAGTQSCFLYLRGGAEVSEVQALDRHTGERLGIGVVPGEVAVAHRVPGALKGEAWMMVPLPRPIPEHGEARLRISLRYWDDVTYRGDRPSREDKDKDKDKDKDEAADADEPAPSERFVFERPIGVRRAAFVLPAGYEILRASAPVQVRVRDDGRLEASFQNPADGAVLFRLEGRALPPTASAAPSAPLPAPEPATPSAPTLERAGEEREIVYFLNDPATSSFLLHHDWTEARAGTERYLNVVRPGSRASDPSARLLDTGEALRVETRSGAEVTAAGWGEAAPEAEVVVVHHPRVEEGRSLRLRVTETYTDATRYRLEGDELAFDRNLGRPRNAIVLPSGWFLTATSMPATISTTEDGRIRLDYANPRPDQLAVSLRARRAKPAEGSSP